MANIHREQGGFDWIPPAVGAGSGLALGALDVWGGGLGKYRLGVGKALLGLAGFAGEWFLGWDSDVTYALMTTAAHDLAIRVPFAIKQGPGALLQYAAPEPVRAAPQRVAAGCTSCAQKAAALAPQAPVPGFFHGISGFRPARETAPTAAGAISGPFAKEVTPTAAGQTARRRYPSSTAVTAAG